MRNDYYTFIRSCWFTSWTRFLVKFGFTVISILTILRKNKDANITETNLNLEIFTEAKLGSRAIISHDLMESIVLSAQYIWPQPISA